MARGDRAGAVDRLQAAETRLLGLNMKVHGMAARYWRGDIDPRGSDDRSAAEAFLRTQGITQPRHISGMLVPGFRRD